MTATGQVSYYSQHTDADPTRRSYSIGDQAAQRVVRLAQEAGTVAVDIETAGLNDKAFTVKVVIIATSDTACVLDATDSRHRESVREALSVARKLVFHNSPFDVPPLVAAGLMRVKDIDKVVDTLVYARMAFTGERDGRGLSDLEKRFLSAGFRSESKDRFAEWAKVNRFKKGEAFEKVSYQTPVYAMYAGWDGVLTSMLLDPVRDAARKQLLNHPFGRYGADADQAAYLLKREQRVNRVMLRRSARGLLVDADRITAEQERIRLRMLELAADLSTHGVTEASNRNQLAKALEEAEAIPEDYPRTATGKVSTAAKNLGAIDHPAVRAFTDYDDHRRLFTYLENSRLVSNIAGGRIHPQVNVLHARTGRMSYSNPALQQFTTAAREAILADPGDTLVSIDWSQIEPVIAANLSNDSGPLTIYESESGGDLYTVAAEAAGVPRKTAKVVLLAMLYGQGTRSLAAGIGADLDTAKAVRAKVAAAMPMTDRFTGWAAVWSGAVGKTWTMSGRVIDVDQEFGYKGTNFCLASDTPVLRSDLRHVPAFKVQVGDRLVGFDEYPGDSGSGKAYRRMRTAVVEAVCTVLKPSVTVHAADGRSTLCSADHLWLVRPAKARRGESRNQWVRADALSPGDALLSIGTWKEQHTRLGGYLAGLLDGEGYLRTRTDTGYRTMVEFSQLAGSVMDEYCLGLDTIGIPYNYQPNSPGNTSTTDSVYVHGVRTVMRILGMLQPRRFRDRFEGTYEGAALTGGLAESVLVESVEGAGHLELTSIQTSTRTLVANGFLSHNCVQGSSYDILAESLVAIDEAGLADGVYLAMHDELVVSSDIAHETAEIMRRPPQRLIELAGRTPLLRVDAADLGERWGEA